MSMVVRETMGDKPSGQGVSNPEYADWFDTDQQVPDWSPLEPDVLAHVIGLNT